jgi:glutamine synthetase
LRVVPEADSFLSLQIKDFTHHRFLAHLVDENGAPHPRDPRGVLKKLVDKAHNMGIEPYMFSEVEFFVVDENGNPVDKAGYCSLPPLDTSYEFRHELGQICKAAGMKVKRIHHECGHGQNEIELNLTPCMKNADDTLLCQWILEVLAAQRKQKIIFSPKPFAEEAGNGMHHHILFRDINTGENIFLNPKLRGVSDIPSDDMERLSNTCKHGIAGLLKYADEITAVFAASDESFKRLQPGCEAPSLTAWDFSNRTALVRVPQTSNETVRFEYRGGDLSGSVHLFGAVLLAAVLKGIEDKLEAPPNSSFNVEMLSTEELDRLGIRSVPKTLEHCLEILKTSQFLREALGTEMVDVLIQRDEDLLASMEK